MNTVLILDAEIILSRVQPIELPPAMATYGNGQYSTMTMDPGLADVRAVRPGCAPHANGTAGGRAAICGESLGAKVAHGVRGPENFLGLVYCMRRAC